MTTLGHKFSAPGGKRNPMLIPAARHRRGLIVALVLGLAATVGGLVTTTANASSPTAPVRIQIDSITSAVQAPSGTPSGSVPYVLAKAGDSFSVHVSFYDSSGAPASFNNDTTLAITSNKGALTPSTGTALKGATTATIVTSLASAANQVSLTVSVASGPLAKSVAPGTSSPEQYFDVLTALQFETSSAPFQKGIGGDGGCANATKANPVCAVVVLPFGANSDVLLSLGVCDAAYAGCGSVKGSLIQTLANLSDLGYSETAPATVIVKCDKSLCGGGAIANVHLNFTFAGNGAVDTQALPCPAKGTVGTDQQACVDYVQSKRDGSGDTHLYFLTPRDVRISVG